MTPDLPAPRRRPRPAAVAIPDGRHGIDFTPALGAAHETSSGGKNGAGKPGTGTSNDGGAAGGIGIGGGTSGETGETLHTTIASGNGCEGAEPRASPCMSIMEIFDAPNHNNNNNGGGGGGGGGGGAVAAPAADAAPRRGSRYASSGAAATPLARSAKSTSHAAWKKANSQSKTAPPSTSTAGSGSAERHGYLSFSEVQVRTEGEREGGADEERFLSCFFGIKSYEYLFCVL